MKPLSNREYCFELVKFKPDRVEAVIKAGKCKLNINSNSLY